MKFTISAVVLGLSALAIASPLEERGKPKRCDKFAAMIPDCAIVPIVRCAQKSGCQPDDYKCVCMKQQAIGKCAAPKIAKKCSDEDAAAAAAATAKVCKCALKPSPS